MAQDFLAGCLGGCAGILVGHPLDTVKVHLQTQDARNPKYRGTFDCLKTIVAKDSARGLYRGLASPLGGVAFINAILFGVYGNVQRNFGDPDSLTSHFWAGTVAGLVQSLVASPMELAKTRMQIQANYRGGVKHRGPLDCLNYIRRTEGLRGVFRGLGITAIRDAPGLSSYFVSYELMMRLSDDPSLFHTLMAGGLAGCFSWLTSFPMDVIKSRLQADGIDGKRQYTGIVDCMRKGYQAEGLAFYRRGLAPTLLRAFPTNAACFLVVSTIMKTDGLLQIDVAIRPVDKLAIAASIPIAQTSAQVSQTEYVLN